MTRERMEDLRAALVEHGWRLLDHEEDARASTDPFVLEREALTWVIVRGAASAAVALKFQAFGDMGRRTDRLNDVAWCALVDGDAKLHFSKRNSQAWRDELARFVLALDEHAEQRRTRS